MKILCCADIHMGRIPSVPYINTLSSHASWDAIVDKALKLKVDVLVLAGDVVDQEDNWYEAYGPLLLGLEKLHNSNIKVIGIGGNHDYSVFPSLAKESSHIKILGLGEKWESYDYKGVRFIGWSFASNRKQENPFDSFDKELTNTNLPLLGLLHCDVGLSHSSNYAPVCESDFIKTNVPLWTLGHIHKGQMLKNCNAFYCGSPFALDSNEKGVHGAWLLERDKTGPWKNPIKLQICSYQFENISVDLSQAKDEEDIRISLTKSMREIAIKHPSSQTLLCSLELRGNINRTLNINKILNREKIENLWKKQDQTTVHLLFPYVDNTHLEVNLEEISRGVGAVALLAQKLLDKDQLALMVKEYKQIEEESYNSSAFSLLSQNQSEKSDEEYLLLVRQAGERLLFSMLNKD